MRRIGVIASCHEVVASRRQLEAYRADWPELVGVEVGGGGVARALLDGADGPSLLVIRGASDLADGRDNAGIRKAWQAHACRVAAAYAIGLLRDGPVPAGGPR